MVGADAAEIHSQVRQASPEELAGLLRDFVAGLTATGDSAGRRPSQ